MISRDSSYAVSAALYRKIGLGLSHEDVEKQSKSNKIHDILTNRQGNIPEILHNNMQYNREYYTQNKKDSFIPYNPGNINVNDKFESTFYNLSKSKNISDNVIENVFPYKKLMSKSLGRNKFKNL